MSGNNWPQYMRQQRPQNLCEAAIERGPRQRQPCLNSARWKRIGPTDQGARFCGTHARAYTRDSLVEIGSPGWLEA